MMKNKILKVAIDLFAHYGIKGVSMSQIAGTLQMSKKTLYLEFENKEELLLECLKFEEERIRKILKKTEEECTNPMETLVLSMSNMYYYRSNFCPSFFRDLQRYPEIQDKFINTKAQLHHLYMKYFHEGVEKGYFQDQFEYEAIAALFIEQLGDWDNMQQPYIILTFLRGVCTEKGLRTLDSFIPAKAQSI